MDTQLLTVDAVVFHRLLLCEKALAEYLDTKRLTFPRFCFVSSADLLDILSNGTNPQQVPPLIVVLNVYVFSFHPIFVFYTYKNAVCSWLLRYVLSLP